MKVIGRKSEIGQILKLYDSGKSEFVVVYGRRRVGKTFLVNQFFDNKFLFKVTGLAVKDKAAQLVKFFEAKVENEKLALEALSYIRRLYDVEAEADALDAADNKPDHERRKALRQEKAYPEIKKFETWMEASILKCPPKSLMEEAISYTYKILKKLSLYVTDGRYKIDNNMVENSIRPLAIGRKNYLFCGDDDAAQRAAVVYSLLATCKAHGVNERAWLEDVLRRIPEYEQAGKDYADLLPANWRALSAK